jgi:hypothetical protein
MYLTAPYTNYDASDDWMPHQKNELCTIPTVWEVH